MTPNPRRANGHRRNQLRRRVLAEEHDCWLCGQPVDKTLGKMPNVHSRRCMSLPYTDCTGCVPDPMSPEVDEVIPVSRGGDPLDRANCRLSHRACNRRRGDGSVQRRKVVPLRTTRSW